MKQDLSAGVTLSGVSAFVIAAFAFSSPAAAGTMAAGINSTLNITLSQEQAGRYVVTPAHWRRSRRRARRLRRSHRRDHYYRGGSSYGYSNRSCHATSKTDYWYGRKAKIGGTMCYDSYGRSYIVPGSRYVIHYYDY